MTPVRFIFAAIILASAAAGYAQAQKDEAKPKVLVNPEGDIQVVTDRSGTLVEFFQKQRILAGGLQRGDTEKLANATKPMEKVFVNYASFNDDKDKTALFGATVTIAPLGSEPKKLVADYLTKHKEGLGPTLILRRDAKEDGVYHVVGLTTRSSVGFFTQKKRVGKDDFSQKDLMYEGTK